MIAPLCYSGFCNDFVGFKKKYMSFWLECRPRPAAAQALSKVSGTVFPALSKVSGTVFPALSKVFGTVFPALSKVSGTVFPDTDHDLSAGPGKKRTQSSKL